MAMDKHDIANATGIAVQGSMAGQMDKPSPFNLRATLQVEAAQLQQRLAYPQEALDLLERNPDTARLMELMALTGLRHYS